MFYQKSLTILLTGCVLFTLACPTKNAGEAAEIEIPLHKIPSQRLNYRFEADVPAAEGEGNLPVQSFERNEAVQLTFDKERPLEELKSTITSPNGQKVVAVYKKIEDDSTEFRLDIFSTDGKLIRKVTHEEMAVHFPEVIRWSPDSNNVAFVAMVRGQKKDIEEGEERKTPTPSPSPESEVTPTEDDSTEDTETDSNSETGENSTEGTAIAPDPPEEVITFRTEQIYICDALGGGVKPLTQNEGLIYFYFVWSPDSNSLASLATTITEWRIRDARMKNAGLVFVPQGRPRMVEKNGRERLLDDYPTYVHPVWSSDSAKIAVAFNKQVRIYDAIGNQPTQSAIPLKNDLLIASKAYEEQQIADGNELVNANTNSKTANTNQETNANLDKESQGKTTLPSAKSLVSFQPIIKLEWNQESYIYLQTGWVQKFNDETENTSSFLRWHRLVLSPQAMTVENTPAT